MRLERGMIEAILESTPDIMVILNRDGTVWYCTDKVRGLGWSAGELLGMPFEILIPESVREDALMSIAAELRRHGIADLMVPIERKGMAPVELSLRWIEFAGPEGIEGAVVLLSGATAAALTSEYLAIFRHLLVSTTMDEFLDRVLDEVKGLPIDAVTTYQYSAELNQFSVLHAWLRGKDVKRAGLIVPHNYTHLTNVVSSGRPVIRPSFQREEHLFPIDTMHRDDGVRADASYPLVVRGRVGGAVTFGSFQTDHFTPALKNTMELLADVISGFLEKEEETRRIEARSARYRVLAESVREPVATVSRDGQIVFSNAAFRDLVGADGGTVFEALDGEAREAVFQLMEAVSKGGRDARDAVVGGRAVRIDAVAASAVAEHVHLVLSDAGRDRDMDALATMVENLPHPAIAVDEGGAVTRASEAARRIFGRLEGRALAEAVPALAQFLGTGEASGDMTIDTRRFRVDRQSAVGSTVVEMVDVTPYLVRDDASGRELERLRGTVRTLSALGIAVVRTSGDRIVEWPPEATRLTGIEGKGMDLFDALGIDRRRAGAQLDEGAMSIVAETGRGGERLPVNVMAVRAHGDIEAVLMDYTPERGLQEKLNEYARSLEGRIAELQEDLGRASSSAQERLDALSSALEEVSGAIQDIMYVRDSSGRILYLSQSGKETLGVRDLPVPVSKLLADPDVEASRALLADAPASDETPAFIDVAGPRGTVALEILERPVEGARLEDHLRRAKMQPSGRLFVGIARNITRRIEMERQIEAYTARLEEKARRTDDALARQMEEMAFFQSLAMDLVGAEGPPEGGRRLLDWAAKWLSDVPMAFYLVNVETGRYELVARRGAVGKEAGSVSVLHADRLRTAELSEGKVPVTFTPRERDVMVLGKEETTLVPIFSGSDLVGVLATLRRPPEGYTLSSLLFHTGIFFEQMRTRADLTAKTALLSSVAAMQRASIETLDPDAILGTVMERLVDVCRSDAAILVIDDGGPKVFRVFPVRGVRVEPGKRVELSLVSMGEMVNQGEVLVKDLRAEGTSGGFEAALLDAGVLSFLVMPIVRGGGLLGAIYLCRTGEAAFTRDEVRSARDLSGFASVAVDRGLSHRQLEMLERHYETIVEASLDGIAIVKDGEIAYANGAMARLVRRRREELVGSDLLSIAMPEDRDRMEEAMSAAAEIGKGAEVGFRAETGKGDAVALRATLLGIDHHGDHAVLGIFRDVPGPDPAAQERAREAAEANARLEALRKDSARTLEEAARAMADEVAALKREHGSEVQRLRDEARRSAEATADLKERREGTERELAAARASLASAKDLMESLDQLCIVVGRDREIAWVNSAFLRATDFKAADLRGTRWSDIVPVMRKAEADAVLEASDEFEFPILVKRGGDTQVRWRAVAAGEGHYLVGIPITEREGPAPRASPGGISFRMSTGGELEDISADVAALLGYGREEALEVPYFMTKATHPGDAERTKKKLLRLIKFKEFDPEDEYRLVRKDGRTVHVRERLEPIYDGTGKLVGVRGELTDVSGDRAEREGLRDRLAFTASVLDSIPGTGVVAVDRDRTVLHANAAAARMLGTTEEAALGRAVETLVVERSEVIELMKAAIRGDRAEAKLTAAAREGKQRFWASVAPRKKGSDIVGYVVALRPLD